MTSTEHDTYFEYLHGRTWKAQIYRWTAVYPRIARYLEGRALDFGCGIGDFLAFRKNTVGADINPLCIEFCRQRGLDAQLIGDLPQPFISGSFDSAVMDNVLEHIEQPVPVLEEILRLVQPGGALVVGVPGRKGFASDEDHKHFYDLSRLVSLLESTGYRYRSCFYTPFRSSWLDRRLRQYCLYGVFVR